jgi:glutathione synthase/RimK-type ligase-like ATP-grasp enzyme
LILVVTSKGDLTSDYVIQALNRLGASTVRLNTNDLLADWQFAVTPDGQRFSSGNRVIRPEVVTSVYYRRAYTPEPPTSADKTTWFFIAREARIVLRALYAALTCPWISHYAAIAAAENKPRQLAAARRLGFDVPDTIITNDPALAKAFIQHHGVVVTKALSYGDLGDGNVFHTNVVKGWSAEFADDIALAPALLQQFIKKEADYRVTVVDDRVFACRIDSQANERYAIDVRRGLSDPSMKHELVDLPEPTMRRCIGIVADLGLRFGAIDLAEDQDGRLWFLELNPNGQWAWIEVRTGAPISSAIAAALMNG